jgi:hypothetical protein
VARFLGPGTVGLDLDLDMLRAARRRGVAAVQGDMRGFAFACRFGLVAIPYNSLQLLDEAGAVETLRCAAAHLAPGGVVAFEATDFGADHDVEPEVLASTDGVTLTGWLRVDRAAGVLHYHRRFSCDGAVVLEDVVSLRRSGASSAERLVAEAGLRMVSAEWAGLGLRVVAASTIRA